MGMFDPVWLRSFVAVSEALSFTEAAARLGIRQSTASDHVRKLEAACGRRLFVRDTHSVIVTPDGEAMMGFAKSILETSARAMRHFRKEDLQGRVRLGVSEDMVLGGLPHALKDFARAHSGVELELTVAVSETLRTRLHEGKLDIVIQKRLADEGHGTLLWRDPLVWAASPHFRLDPAEPIPLVVLAPPALTRAVALAALEQAGCSWRIICSSDSQSGVHAAASAGLGIAPHAKSLLPPSLAILNDKVLPPLGTTDFIMLKRKGAAGGPVEALAALLTDGRAWRLGGQRGLSAA